MIYDEEDELDEQEFGEDDYDLDTLPPSRTIVYTNIDFEEIPF